MTSDRKRPQGNTDANAPDASLPGLLEDLSSDNAALQLEAAKRIRKLDPAPTAELLWALWPIVQSTWAWRSDRKERSEKILVALTGKRSITEKLCALDSRDENEGKKALKAFVRMGKPVVPVLMSAMHVDSCHHIEKAREAIKMIPLSSASMMELYHYLAKTPSGPGTVELSGGILVSTTFPLMLDLAAREGQPELEAALHFILNKHWYGVDGTITESIIRNGAPLEPFLEGYREEQPPAMHENCHSVLMKLLEDHHECVCAEVASTTIDLLEEDRLSEMSLLSKVVETHPEYDWARLVSFIENHFDDFLKEGRYMIPLDIISRLSRDHTIKNLEVNIEGLLEELIGENDVAFTTCLRIILKNPALFTEDMGATLVGMLSNRDVRDRAEELLVSVGKPAVPMLIRNLMESPHYTFVPRVLEAIGIDAVPTILGLLQDRSSDSDGVPKMLAGEILAGIASKNPDHDWSEAAETLVGLLRDGYFFKPQSLCKSIGQLAEHAKVPLHEIRDILQTYVEAKGGSDMEKRQAAEAYALVAKGVAKRLAGEAEMSGEMLPANFKPPKKPGIYRMRRAING